MNTIYTKSNLKLAGYGDNINTIEVQNNGKVALVNKCYIVGLFELQGILTAKRRQRLASLTVMNITGSTATVYSEKSKRYYTVSFKRNRVQAKEYLECTCKDYRNLCEEAKVNDLQCKHILKVLNHLGCSTLSELVKQNKEKTLEASCPDYYDSDYMKYGDFNDGDFW